MITDLGCCLGWHRVGDGAEDEPLDDVLEEEGSSKSQRLIAWACALLTVAAAWAIWRLL